MAVGADAASGKVINDVIAQVDAGQFAAAEANIAMATADAKLAMPMRKVRPFRIVHSVMH